MTRWLVTGAGGMLGRDLVSVLAPTDDVKLTALGRSDLDITDARRVGEAVAGQDVVVNAAAWTDVDGAETDEAAATAVNGAGVANVAEACRRSGARLLHISTDYVFPGDATAPLPEDAATAPINAYGRSKLAGERAVLGLLPDTGYLVRTAWLYGEHGPNFVTTMLRLAADRETLDVVDDQHGQPTWSLALARRLVRLGQAALGQAGSDRTGPDVSAPAGIYHGTAAGSTTWYGLARAVFAEVGLDPDRIRPLSSGAFAKSRARKTARRPAYSVLGHQRWRAAGLPAMTDWRPMLGEALARPGFRTRSEGAP